MGCFIARHKKGNSESVPTIDMRGYNCLMIVDDTNSGWTSYAYFNGYIEVTERTDGYKNYETFPSGNSFYSLQYFMGDLRESKVVNSVYSLYTYSAYNRIISVYGDVRKVDGTPAETDAPVIIYSKFDCIICK